MPHASTTSSRWSLERVVAELRALHARGELGSTHELQQRGYGTLVAAAIRYAGSWGKAVRLAGAQYSPRRSWTDEAVVREIQQLHRKGASIAATQVETPLLLAAKRYFGSWRKAREAALPNFDAPTEAWTKPKLLKALAELHAEGVSLSSKTLREMGHGRLINAAVRLFGTWEKAQRRAVPDFVPLLESWSKQRVLREIRARHQNKESLNATDVLTDDLRLAAAARRYFGSWRAARNAAGVPFHDPRHSWPKERVISELRRHAPDGIRPTCTRVGQALYKVAIARFGSFDHACRAAGLRPRS